MRTIELGVTITDAAIGDGVTTIFCAPVDRNRAAQTAAAMAVTSIPSPAR
jgi:hypothetical protein